MSDPHVHSDDGRLPRSGIRGMIATASFRVRGVPLLSVTGCGKLRRYVPSTSSTPEQVTCVACRDWSRAKYLEVAGEAEAGYRDDSYPITFREMAERFL